MKLKELYRKTIWLSGFLIFFILAFLISVIFLNPSSVGNENFLWYFNIWASIWAMIFIVVLVLTFVLSRTLLRLFFEYHAGRASGRIKGKLVLTFIIFSLFPALIMFFLAFGLINQNLMKWVSAPSEQLVDSSKVIADRYYAEKKEAVISSARRLAQQLTLSPDTLQQVIEEQFQLHDVRGLLLLNDSGEVLAEEGRVDKSSFFVRNFERILNEGVVYQLDRSVNKQPGMVDEGVVGVPVLDPEGRSESVLLLYFSIPESVAFHADSVRQANEVYTNLKGTLASLRIKYVSILGMTTLALIFGFVWLGNFIAKKLTVPLEALAEGSRELSEGNLDYRVGVKAVDELGVLVDSFNQMAAQLRESRSQLENANAELKKTNVQLDERRKYTETILQNIATGVLTVDEGETIQTANQAALKMLQASPDELVSHPIQKITEPELLEEFREMKKRARLFGTYRKQLTIRRNDRRLYVAATMTQNPLPTRQEAEYIIVLDDLTELIRAEKFAAWQEVARRLAHEIKNPLTPIQLSAERVLRRFERIAGNLPRSKEIDDFQSILKEATQIIIAEARMLRNLVAEFSKFARLPICKPQPVELHSLIDKSLSLYEGSLDAISVEKNFDTEIETLEIDPEQMQRVFVNLIENSLDAMVEENGDRSITIKTHFNKQRDSVTITFADTGHGIEAGDFEHLFLPYFSTKKRGTGLGLAIVRQIISEHNGFIRAEPNQPQGTKVIIEIPTG